MSTPSRTFAVLAVSGLAVAVLSGCGFIAAGDKSATKPSGFVISGHASVALPPTDVASVGSNCAAPTTIPDVAKGVPVNVTNPGGGKIATGQLGPGVVTRDGSAASCTFPFQIRGVPGNEQSYGIAIGSRAPQSFSGDALRASTLAAITITG